MEYQDITPSEAREINLTLDVLTSLINYFLLIINREEIHKQLSMIQVVQVVQVFPIL
jgi:hypothetical protein